MLQMLRDNFERWKNGEMPYERQQKLLVTCMQEFLALKRDYVSRLQAISPRTGAIAAAIDEAETEHDQVVEMFNSIATATENMEVERNAKIEPAAFSMPSFGHGWIVPAPSADGTQSIVKVCCSCGAGHIYDYRVVDGLVEYRSYALENTENGNAKIDAGTEDGAVEGRPGGSDRGGITCTGAGPAHARP